MKIKSLVCCAIGALAISIHGYSHPCSNTAVRPLWEEEPHFVHYKTLVLESILSDLGTILKKIDGSPNKERDVPELCRDGLMLIYSARVVLGIETASDYGNGS